MRLFLLAAAFATAASAAPAAMPVPPKASATFSAAQVEEGRKLFADICATCHGPNLQGAVAPSLIVPAFRASYSSKPMRALYSRIISTMPAGQAGTLSEAQVLKLTALISASNGLPIGDAPVTSASELSARRFPDGSKW
jgi:polar amino acid transport system substrate-binding protein